MLKFFKASFIMIMAVCFLVSLSVVLGGSDSAFEEGNIVEEEGWRLLVGSKKAGYGTKYTILLDGEIYEYFLEYKEVVAEKFKGHYWSMKSVYQDANRDENYIYKDIEITRNDVIKFLEIKDEKLVAKIKEGYEFYLYVEPYYNYKKEKWGDTYTSTVKELYSILPEANSQNKAYENARDENGNLVKSKIQGVEFLRENVVKAMNSISSKNIKCYSEISNENVKYKGYKAYHFEKELKTGEFLKMITYAMWENFEYAQPEEGIHWAKTYANALDRKILMTIDYDNEKLEKLITRKEAARLLSLFYINYNEEYELDDKLDNIKNFKDMNLVTEEIEKICIDDSIRFGLMNGYEDSTFRPNSGLTKTEVEKILQKAISRN